MTAASVNYGGMPVVPALQVLIELRSRDQIVVTNQASARIWPKLTTHPLDLHYNPSTMGGAIPLALGLALAQPQHHVLVVSGDGALLMSLGALVTVVGARAANLTIVVLDNGLYEVTGGQKTPAAGTSLDLAALARSVGFPTAGQFRDLTDWRARAAEMLSLPGPRFLSLAVQPTPPEFLRSATPPLADQLAQLCRELGSEPGSGIPPE
jgi:thiamine pyrophosphate-dependent acetolactate synthase large subunit-like protein